MRVVLAIDALEHTLVEQFQCTRLMQSYYGKTDISEFSQPRTMVLWSSFMTGRNMEREILAKGDKEMWNTMIPVADTFFSAFYNPAVIDLPGYSYDLAQHERERELLKSFFIAGDKDEKDVIRKDYNEHAFAHHRKVKSEFIAAISGSHDFVLGYFSIADVLGHLNFGNRMLMRMVYRDLDELAGSMKSPCLVLSDHGMKSVGIFGDHSEYGFWSTSWKDLGQPRITGFQEIIREMPEK